MADVAPCSRCDGTGEMRCPVCSGTSDPAAPCPRCDGSGVVRCSLCNGSGEETIVHLARAAAGTKIQELLKELAAGELDEN